MTAAALVWQCQVAHDTYPRTAFNHFIFLFPESGCCCSYTPSASSTWGVTSLDVSYRRPVGDNVLPPGWEFSLLFNSLVLTMSFSLKWHEDLLVHRKVELSWINTDRPTAYNENNSHEIVQLSVAIIKKFQWFRELLLATLSSYEKYQHTNGGTTLRFLVLTFRL